MSFGINGADPFKSYATNSDAGGGITGYKNRRKKKSNENDDEKNSILESNDDEDIEVDFDEEDGDFFI